MIINAINNNTSTYSTTLHLSRINQSPKRLDNTQNTRQDLEILDKAWRYWTQITVAINNRSQPILFIFLLLLLAWLWIVSRFVLSIILLLFIFILPIDYCLRLYHELSGLLGGIGFLRNGVATRCCEVRRPEQPRITRKGLPDLPKSLRQCQ